ncbi:protein kinase [Streptomyces sp. HUCO-GS316]|nr:protein kinase [Streptomyces sp. HUCO-GS316]
MVTGRYRLVESIGQGGMGRVWRAADEMLDRQVAVKEMRIDGLDAEDARTRRERTLREARATARIDHPHVVRVYDVVDEGERLWIVMELVDGRSLEGILAEEGPLGPCETARYGLGLVEALRQVHGRGVLHRDIKPGNVLVEHGARRIVLTDFGIAAIQDAKALTMVGMLVGSPDYMAPERISGRPQGPPSDVWSLGATLCAALGGRSPFSRDTTLATLHAVLYEEPELPAAAGPLREILSALLEKDPSVRPSLDDLEAALRPVAFPPPTPTLPVGVAEPPESSEGLDPRMSPEATSGDLPSVDFQKPTPTPVFLDARVIPLVRDPRQPAPVSDAIPPARPARPEEEQPSTHDFGLVRAPAPPPTAPSEPAPAPPEEHPQPLPEVPATPPEHPTHITLTAPGHPIPRHTVPRHRGSSTEAAPAEPPGPPVPVDPRPGRRRTVLAAVGAVAAGTVVAILLAANSGSSGDNRAGPSKSPAVSASTPGDSPSSTVEGTTRPRTLPPGVHEEAGGFAWATPKGWRRDVKTGAEVHYTSPDGRQELAAKSSLARGDLMGTWQTSEENARQGRDYNKIRLEKTTFRGQEAVVWEYTFTLEGVPWHARLLGFNKSGKSYQINTWYQPDIEQQALRTYGKVRDSFTVL